MGSMTRSSCYFTNPPISDFHSQYLDLAFNGWAHIELVNNGKQPPKKRNIYGKKARFKSCYHKDFLTKKAKPRLRFKAYNVENITNG